MFVNQPAPKGSCMVLIHSINDPERRMTRRIYGKWPPSKTLSADHLSPWFVWLLCEGIWHGFDRPPL